MSPGREVYSVHPSVETVQQWVGTLPEKTGRSLEEWVALVRREGPADRKAKREWLKAAHGLGGNTARWIADRADGVGAEEGDPDAYLAAAHRYVEAMYAGAKAALRPIHDRLLELALSLGDDVRICPCQTIVPIYRRHVIAQVKPSTRTRIDFGLALGDTKGRGRLLETGGFAKKDRITHRFAITTVEEVDAEVRRWLETAYEKDR